MFAGKALLGRKYLKYTAKNLLIVVSVYSKDTIIYTKSL